MPEVRKKPPMDEAQQGDVFDPQADYLADADTPSEGEHFADVVSATVGKSKKGDKMITVEFRIIGESPFYGKIIKSWILLKPGRYFFGKLAALCQAINPRMKGKAADPVNGFDPFSQESCTDHLCGSGFVLTVAHEDNEYTDRRGKVVKTKVATADGFRALTKAETEKLKALYDGYTSPPFAEPKAETPPDDDTPF